MRRWLSLALNAAAAFLALRAWLSMALRFGPDGALTAAGFETLKYFTILSNLLQAIASIATVVAYLRRRRFSRRLMRLRYAGTASVALTFFTVLCFLGPLYGYPAMYGGANLWLHLVAPALAMIDFALVEREGFMRLGDARFAALPMLLYAIFYIGNLLKNGVRGNDWYGFAAGGLGGAVIAFAAMSLAAGLIALALWLPRRERKERAS